MKRVEGFPPGERLKQRVAKRTQRKAGRPPVVRNDKELPDVDSNGRARRMKQTGSEQSEWPLIESASAGDLDPSAMNCWVMLLLWEIHRANAGRTGGASL